LKGPSIQARGEFVLLEYKIFFHPQHGSILGIHSNKIYHGTRRNIGYTQVGVILTTKVKIASVGAKIQRDLSLSKINSSLDRS
jgi:hypothetical protein